METNTNTVNRPNNNTITSKAKRKRGYRIPMSADGKANTKLVVLDAMAAIRAGYARMMQVCNGKKVRNIDGVKTDFPLSAMSEERIAWVEEQLAAIHEQTFASLRAGKRTVEVVAGMPD